MRMFLCKCVRKVRAAWQFRYFEESEPTYARRKPPPLMDADIVFRNIKSLKIAGDNSISNSTIHQQ